jgi:hypothetical protein
MEPFCRTSDPVFFVKRSAACIVLLNFGTHPKSERRSARYLAFGVGLEMHLNDHQRENAKLYCL